MENIRENIRNFLFSDYVIYIFYILLALVFIAIVVNSTKIYKQYSHKKKKYKDMLQVEASNLARRYNVTNPAEAKGIKPKKKDNAVVALYKEYIFYGGKPKTLVLALVAGYIGCTLLLLAISRSIGIAMILGFVWFTIMYVFVDSQCAKKRKNYIKGFSQALRTLTASVMASSSFETGVRTIMTREGINEKVKEEFTLINNDLVNNKSQEQVMEEFWERNSSIPEFAMFAIVMQFFSKSGGSGLNKILGQLETSLNQRVMNYAKVDAELGINKTLMNIFVYGYVIALVVVPFFYTTFYTGLIDAGMMGYVKVLGSVALHLVSVVMYKGLIRKCSEGA